MSEFECNVVKVDAIEVHPNADSIEIVKIGGFNCITTKGRFQAGDPAVYVPEGAVLPEWLLEELDLAGKLAGPDKNRVKIIKLRGVYSQGVLLSISPDGILYGPSGAHGRAQIQVNLGDNVADFLGIKKYEPPIPVAFAGQVTNIGSKAMKYDVESIQKYPDVFKPGESVYYTEKLHGTFCCIGMHPELDDPELFGRKWFVYSKGLGAQGLVFKNVDANKGNVYVKNILRLDPMWLQNCVAKYVITQGYGESPAVYIFGEIFGKGVQDLTYGLSEPQFRVFDVTINGNPLSELELAYFLTFFAEKMESVPVLWSGLWESMDHAALYRDGRDTIKGANVREGIVIRTSVPRYSEELQGRAKLKYVSPGYLLRKGDTTEFN